MFKKLFEVVFRKKELLQEISYLTKHRDHVRKELYVYRDKVTRYRSLKSLSRLNVENRQTIHRLNVENRQTIQSFQKEITMYKLFIGNHYPTLKDNS